MNIDLDLGVAEMIRDKFVGVDSGQIEGNGQEGGEAGAEEVELALEAGNVITERRIGWTRKSAREGPSERIAVNEESAITRALSQAARNRGSPIFQPLEGTLFSSSEEARDFFNLYSWEIGFGIRYGRSNKNNKGYTTRQDIVCSCEGSPRTKNCASIRTGCKVMIRLLRTSDHGWYISRVSTSHNHKLSEGYAEKKQWNSHSMIDPSTKYFIKKLRDNNVSIGRVCSIIGVTDSSAMNPVRKETIRSLCAKVARENMADDIGKTVQLLREMKIKDPLMEVRFKVDEKGTVKSMLWCTGKNRMDYKNFGDVVTFDTTYRTNLYSLPFGIFIGVNCHFQSIIFGGVLLSTETAEDFQWAFQNFIEMMDGSVPITVLTDQCAAMGKAIRTVLPGTRHRWCRWHVLKSAKKKLGKVIARHKQFKSDFYNLITNETCVDSFELSWKKLIIKYRLVKSKYMLRLYKHREKWAKPYFMSVFCAGMTSTQRSESANHMLKRYIQKAAPMHLFVSKFNEFLCDRTEQEAREQHVTKMVTRRMRVGAPIEEHADLVYTRAMYEKFYDELFEAGKFCVQREDGNDRFIVSSAKLSSDGVQKKYVVTLHGEDFMSCQCGLYEHLGMLCRHALKVLLHLDRQEIPKFNIMRRWTKEAVVYKAHGEQTDIASDADQMRKKALMLQTLQIVHGPSPVDEQMFRNAMEALRPADRTQREDPPFDGQYQCSLHDDAGPVPLSCPPRTMKGGRPPSTGLNAWISRKDKRRTLDSSLRDPISEDWPEEEMPPSKKTRCLKDI